mmetsp:Transcript_18646/g.57916  ORF Transcript_18646/g.57916 Transcript_18646/m.57916 type:complete len:200 (-) Transcript_18646:8-607(-)
MGSSSSGKATAGGSAAAGRVVSALLRSGGGFAFCAGFVSGRRDLCFVTTSPPDDSYSFESEGLAATPTTFPFRSTYCMPLETSAGFTSGGGGGGAKRARAELSLTSPLPASKPPEPGGTPNFLTSLTENEVSSPRHTAEVDNVFPRLADSSPLGAPPPRPTSRLANTATRVPKTAAATPSDRKEKRPMPPPDPVLTLKP